MTKIEPKPTVHILDFLYIKITSISKIHYIIYFNEYDYIC